MKYTSLTLVKKKEDEFQIHYTRTDKDTTGIGGTWEGGGVLAVGYKVNKYYVLCNPFNQKPFLVAESLQEISNVLYEINGVKLEI